MERLKITETTHLSEEDSKNFVEALEKPVEINERLLKVVKEYKERVDG